MIKVILAAVILVVLAVAGLGIRMLFDRKAEFSGGSCQASKSDELQARGISSCGCGGGTCASDGK
jgi:hypothetical protein